MSDPARDKTMPPSPAWLWTLRAVLGLGLILCSYLTAVSLTEGLHPPGCGADSSCEQVLGSPLSRIAGVVPVGLPAVPLYAVALAASALLTSDTTGRQRRVGWMILAVVSFAVLGAAGWFVFLQSKIGAFCVWCLSTHACGLVAALLILWRAPFDRGGRDGALSASFAVLAVVIAVVGVGGVAAGQMFQPARRVEGQLPTPPAAGPATFRIRSPFQAERTVSLLQGQLQLEMPLPTIGHPDAPHVMVELFDYCCSHCRRMHKRVEQILRHYGDRVAFVPLVHPFDSKCNPKVKKTNKDFEEACELARLSLAVFRADPAQFQRMHDFMMTGSKAPKAEEARQFASDLVGAGTLERVLRDPWLADQIRTHMSLHQQTSGGKKKDGHLPKVIHAKALFTGMPDFDKFCEHLETELGVPAPVDEAEEATPAEDSE